MSNQIRLEDIPQNMSASEFCARLRALIVAPKGHEKCERCNGVGSIGSEDRFTDNNPGAGEVQWRGYRPTNFCIVCDGTGCWPPYRPKAGGAE